MIFNLSSDLNVPVSKYETRTFSAAECGLSYLVHNSSPFNKHMIVSLVVVSLDTKQVLYTIGTNHYSEAGQQEQTNVAEVQASNEARRLLETELNTLYSSYSAATTDGERALIQTDIDAKRTELQNFVPVQPAFKTINLWSDIVGVFNTDGTLTPEGLTWALTNLTVGTVPLSDIIVTA